MEFSVPNIALQRDRVMQIGRHYADAQSRELHCMTAQSPGAGGRRVRELLAICERGAPIAGHGLTARSSAEIALRRELPIRKVEMTGGGVNSTVIAGMRVLRRTIRSAIAVCVCMIGAVALGGSMAAAQTVKIGVGTGIGYLPMQVMAKNQLLEQAARAAGLGETKVELIEFATSNAMTDALLSGAIQYATGGVSTFAVLWAKAEGGNQVRGIGALVAMPMYLNTRNPRIKSIKDFDDRDRIGVAGVKSSYQAMLIQMAAADAFGFQNYAKLDSLTVAVSNPNGVIALGNPKSEINTHFTPPPFADWELKMPGVHTVLTSYDILGGPATLNMVWAATRFARENPKMHAAFWTAFQEATRQINADKAAAAQVYLQMSGDKKSSVAEILALLNHPQISYNVTPNRVMRVIDFLSKAGAIKRNAASWRDLFFSEVHALPGS